MRRERGGDDGPGAFPNKKNVVTQKGRVAHLSRSTVAFVDIHLGTDGGGAVALDDAAADVGEEDGEIGIGAK